MNMVCMYPCYCWWLFVLFTACGYYKWSCYDIRCHVFRWTYVLISVCYIPMSGIASSQDIRYLVLIDSTKEFSKMIGIAYTPSSSNWVL